MTAEVQQAPRHIQRKWCAELGRHVVHSRDLAQVIAHKHFNLLDALKLTIGDWPRVADNVHWTQYVTANNRIHPAAMLSSMAVATVGNRLHNVPGCRDVRLRLEAISEALKTADELRHLQALKLARAVVGEPPRAAEPAPDEEINPPLEEPPGLFDRVEPQADVPSWKINATIQFLTERAGVPLYIGQDLIRWNKDRCDKLWEELYRRGGSWAAVSAIYDTKPSEAE